MELFELLDFGRDYKNYNDDNYYTLREFLEVVEDWNTEQIHVFERFKNEIDFTHLTNLIKNQEYIIYESLEDYIYETLGEEGLTLPNWLCISAYDTYFYSLRYDDNLYFLDDVPQFAKDSEEYGDSASRQKWLDGVRYLVDNSEVILLLD